MKMLRFLIFSDFYGKMGEIFDKFIKKMGYLESIKDTVQSVGRRVESSVESSTERLNPEDEARSLLDSIKKRFGEKSTQYMRMLASYEKILRDKREGKRLNQAETRRELNIAKLNHSRDLIKRDGLDTSLAWGGKAARLVGLGVEAARLVSGESVLRTYEHQDDLVKKILGSENGFGNGYLQGFNSKEGGNFVIKVSEFEQILKRTDIKNINSLAFANYLKYLQSRGNVDVNMLIDKLGDNNILKLQEIWTSKDDDNSQKAKKTIEEFSWGKNLITAVEVFSIKKPKEFIENIKNQSQEQKSITLKLILKNINSMKNSFHDDLVKSIKSAFPNISEAEINRKVNELWSRLEHTNDIKSLEDVYKALEGMDPEEIKKLAGKALELKHEEKRAEVVQVASDMTKAKANGDTEALRRLEQKQERLQSEIAISQAQQRFNQTRQASDIEGYINGTRDIKTDIEEAKKQDKEFKDLYNEAQKQQQAYDKKYPSQGNISLNERQDRGYTTLTYHDGSTFTYQVTSSSVYDIVTPIGNISVSPQEFSVVSSNKDALKNLISFKSTLNQLNLGNLWRYREPIFRSLANTKTLSFETKNDYINEGELKIFLKSIMTSLGKEVDPKKDLREIKQEILQANLGEDPLTRQDEVGISGNSSLEEQFVMMFDPKRDGNFLQNKFEQALQNKIT